MTLKQLLLRYLKEKGFYSILSEKAYSSLVRNNIRNGKESFFLANFIIVLSDSMKRYEWQKYQSNVLKFFNEWARNEYSVKSGDTITVNTIDGKYSYDFIVTCVNEYTLSVLLENGNSIDLDRIIAVNGKPTDFLHGWHFKKNIDYIY